MALEAVEAFKCQYRSHQTIRTGLNFHTFASIGPWLTKSSQEDLVGICLMILHGSALVIGRENVVKFGKTLGWHCTRLVTSLQYVHSNYFIRVLCVLQNNIKKYSQLTLLSPSIFHYKGSIPKDYQVVSLCPGLNPQASDSQLRNLC